MKNLQLKIIGGAMMALAIMAPFTMFASDIVANLQTDASSVIDPKALPMGNGYSDSPKAGSIYPCMPDAYYFLKGKPMIVGSWQHGNTFDLTQKPVVQGEVSWSDAYINISTEDNQRIIETNNLPVGGKTGVFPTQKTDPAYQYDPNPNPIKPQSISISIPKNPVIAKTPSCVELPIAISLDGVLFFNALDSHGNNEIAYEMQDSCGGMAESSGGYYHRHSISDCIPHIHEKNALVGYALDGFGIFSPYDANGKELTTKDLDECHGTTSEIMWDGKKVNMYHYVLTRDYPYTIGCFKGEPISITLPPPPSLSDQFLGAKSSFFAVAWSYLLQTISAFFNLFIW